MHCDILFICPPSVNFDNKNNPKVFINTSFFPPVAAPYLAAFMEKYNFKTEIIDMDADKLGVSKIPNILKTFQPKIIGISIGADMLFPISLLIVEEIRKVSNIPVIVGGVFPSSSPEYLLNKSSIDYVVRGEGENTLLELTQYILLKEGDLKKIDGISFKENDKIIHNPDRALIKDLDEIPFPAWEKLNLKRYFIAISYKRYSFGITASRGCPFHCNFCTLSVFKGYRVRTPQNVADEIQFAIKNFNIKDITFHDATLNVNPKWVISLCKELLKRKIKIKWRCLCRVDKIDERMIAYMKKAGCYNISFGLETSQDKFLDFLAKGTTVAQIERAVKIVKKYNIEVLGNFMLGIPGQTVDDLRQCIRFIKKLELDYLNIAILTPLTGSEIEKYAIKKGWITTFDISDLDVPELLGTRTHKWEIPDLPNKILDYYRRMGFLSYYINFRTFKRYFLRYIKTPSRILNAINNAILRFVRN